MNELTQEEKDKFALRQEEFKKRMMHIRVCVNEVEAEFGKGNAILGLENELITRLAWDMKNLDPEAQKKMVKESMDALGRDIMKVVVFYENQPKA